MPTVYNPYTGHLELVPKSSGGSSGPTLPPVHLTADDGNIAQEATNQLRVAGITGIVTSASGNQLNLQITGIVATNFKTDDNNVNSPSTNTITVAGDTGSGITTTGITNGVKVQATSATTSQKGVASYNPSHFTVTTGQVNAKLASTSAAGYASFDSTAFAVDGTGKVTFTKAQTPSTVTTDSGTATESGFNFTLHGNTGLGIAGTGSTINVTLNPATASQIGGVIPGTQFAIDGSGNLTLNTVSPAKGGTGLVNPTANQIPVTQGSSNYTSVPVTAGQVLGGSSSGPKGLTLNGDNGVQITTDTSSVNFKTPYTSTWQTISASTTNTVIGRQYILKGSAAQTITPTYTTNTSVLSTRIIGGSNYPMTIAIGSSSGSPDTLMINGQTATTQIQAVEPWASCEIVCTNVIPTEFTPGFFIYQCTWQVLPIAGNFTVS